MYSASWSPNGQQLAYADGSADVVVVTPNANANVGVSMLADNDNYGLLDPIFIAMLCRNFGPDAAANAVVRLTLPPGVTFVSAGAGGVLNGSTITWNIASLSSGSNVSLPVNLRVNDDPTLESLTFTATISASAYDPAPANNTESLMVSVAQ